METSAASGFDFPSDSGAIAVAVVEVAKGSDNAKEPETFNVFQSYESETRSGARCNLRDAAEKEGEKENGRDKGQEKEEMKEKPESPGDQNAAEFVGGKMESDRNFVVVADGGDGDDQRSDDDGHKSHDNDRKSDDNDQKSDDNDQKSDDNDQKRDDNDQKSDDNDQKSYDSDQISDDSDQISYDNDQRSYDNDQRSYDNDQTSDDSDDDDTVRNDDDDDEVHNGDDNDDVDISGVDNDSGHSSVSNYIVRESESQISTVSDAIYPGPLLDFSVMDDMGGADDDDCDGRNNGDDDNDKVDDHNDENVGRYDDDDDDDGGRDVGNDRHAGNEQEDDKDDAGRKEQEEAAEEVAVDDIKVDEIVNVTDTNSVVNDAEDKVDDDDNNDDNDDEDEVDNDDDGLERKTGQEMCCLLDRPDLDSHSSESCFENHICDFMQAKETTMKEAFLNVFDEGANPCTHMLDILRLKDVYFSADESQNEDARSFDFNSVCFERNSTPFPTLGSQPFFPSPVDMELLRLIYHLGKVGRPLCVDVPVREPSDFDVEDVPVREPSDFDVEDVLLVFDPRQHCATSDLTQYPAVKNLEDGLNPCGPLVWKTEKQLVSELSKINAEKWTENYQDYPPEAARLPSNKIKPVSKGGSFLGRMLRNFESCVGSIFCRRNKYNGSISNSESSVGRFDDKRCHSIFSPRGEFPRKALNDSQVSKSYPTFMDGCGEIDNKESTSVLPKFNGPGIFKEVNQSELKKPKEKVSVEKQKLPRASGRLRRRLNLICESTKSSLLNLIRRFCSRRRGSEEYEMMRSDIYVENVEKEIFPDEKAIQDDLITSEQSPFTGRFEPDGIFQKTPFKTAKLEKCKATSSIKSFKKASDSISWTNFASLFGQAMLYSSEAHDFTEAIPLADLVVTQAVVEECTEKEISDSNETNSAGTFSKGQHLNSFSARESCLANLNVSELLSQLSAHPVSHRATPNHSAHTFGSSNFPLFLPVNNLHSCHSLMSSGETATNFVCNQNAIDSFICPTFLENKFLASRLPANQPVVCNCCSTNVDYDSSRSVGECSAVFDASSHLTINNDCADFVTLNIPSMCIDPAIGAPYQQQEVPNLSIFPHVKKALNSDNAGFTSFLNFSKIRTDSPKPGIVDRKSLERTDSDNFVEEELEKIRRRYKGKVKNLKSFFERIKLSSFPRCKIDPDATSVSCKGMSKPVEKTRDTTPRISDRPLTSPKLPASSISSRKPEFPYASSPPKLPPPSPQSTQSQSTSPISSELSPVEESSIPSPSLETDLPETAIETKSDHGKSQQSIKKSNGMDSFSFVAKGRKKNVGLKDVSSSFTKLFARLFSRSSLASSDWKENEEILKNQNTTEKKLKKKEEKLLKEREKLLKKMEENIRQQELLKESKSSSKLRQNLQVLGDKLGLGKRRHNQDTRTRGSNTGLAYDNDPETDDKTDVQLVKLKVPFLEDPVSALLMFSKNRLFNKSKLSNSVISSSQSVSLEKVRSAEHGMPPSKSEKEAATSKTKTKTFPRKSHRQEDNMDAKLCSCWEGLPNLSTHRESEKYSFLDEPSKNFDTCMTLCSKSKISKANLAPIQEPIEMSTEETFCRSIPSKPILPLRQLVRPQVNDSTQDLPQVEEAQDQLHPLRVLFDQMNYKESNEQLFPSSPDVLPFPQTCCGNFRDSFWNLSHMLALLQTGAKNVPSQFSCCQSTSTFHDCSTTTSGKAMEKPSRLNKVNKLDYTDTIQSKAGKETAGMSRHQRFRHTHRYSAQFCESPLKAESSCLTQNIKSIQGDSYGVDKVLNSGEDDQICGGSQWESASENHTPLESRRSTRVRQKKKGTDKEKTESPHIKKQKHIGTKQVSKILQNKQIRPLQWHISRKKRGNAQHKPYCPCYHHQGSEFQSRSGHMNYFTCPRCNRPQRQIACLHRLH